MKDSILVIGIAGGTGSGKTTLMDNLIGQFPNQVTILSHDNYYRRHDNLTYEQRCKLNYDEPASLETDLMARHLEALRRGEAVECPVYDFTSSQPFGRNHPHRAEKGHHCGRDSDF